MDQILKLSSIKATSYQFAQEYIFSTVSFSAISDDLKILFYALYTVLAELSKIIIGLILCLSLVTLKLGIALLPHAMQLFRSTVEFHKKLSYYDILIETGLITILLLLFLYQKKIAEAFKSIERSISVKSKAIAKSLPHILYFTSSLIAGVLGRKFILPLTANKYMPIFTTVIPLITLLLFMQKREIVLDVKQILLINHRFTAIVAIAIYHSIVTAASTIPFSNRLLSFLPYVKETMIVILVWIQISSNFCQIVFTSLIRPVMSKIALYLPFSNPSTLNIDHQERQAHQQKKNLLLTVIRTMNILSDAQLSFISNCFQDSMVMIVALLFLFFPYPFSYIGMVTIGFILPAFQAVSLVNRLSQHRLEVIRRNSVRTHDTVNPALIEKDRLLLRDNVIAWANYWVCLLSLWLFRIYVNSLFPSIIIITTVWLQHSYFQGASKTVPFIMLPFHIIYDCYNGPKIREAQPGKR